MGQISVHRGLKELKLLSSRISKTIQDSQFIGVIKGNAKVVKGQDVEEFKRDIQGSYQSVIALINRRARIKSAIVLSNAGVEAGTKLRRIKVAGQEWTVAEAIEYKSSVSYEVELLNAMKAQYSEAQTTIERENLKAEARFDEYVNTMLGKDAKQKLTPDELDSFRTKFDEVNKFSLIDPLAIKKKIADLDEKIDAFLLDVDTVLSEDNGITLIEVAD